MKVKLWSINRWLRYTGFRFAVDFDVDAVIFNADAVKQGTYTRTRKPTALELFWVGLPGSAGWKRWEPDT